MGSFWTDRPTLVTGATGLVGSALVARLREAGADIVCLVRDWIPGSALLESGTYEKVKSVRGAVEDYPLIERVIGEYEIDTVIHLAAQAIVRTANRSPLSTFEANIRGTWSLLEACRLHPEVRQIVVASSDKAYGESRELPYAEDTPLRGRHPYDVSKSCADLLAQSYAATYRLPVTISRCGNFYGGGDLNWNRIIPGTIRSVLRGESLVIRSDGSPTRDYFYVEDGASAYMLLAQELATRPELAGEAFNFSNEEPLSVLQIVQRVLRSLHASLEPQVLNIATNEIPHQYLDATKAKNVLGWSATYSLEEGLAETVRWYREYFGSTDRFSAKQRTSMASATLPL